MKQFILEQLDPDILPTKADCGRYQFNKIYGGEQTEISEFPWMALLEYDVPCMLNLHRLTDFRLYLKQSCSLL